MNTGSHNGSRSRSRSNHSRGMASKPMQGSLPANCLQKMNRHATSALMTVRTRFAPSPTGPLHIGGVRTALFNYLYARHMGGAFLLRIEDTDRERSTDEATRGIIESLDWLGLARDEQTVFQSTRMARHAEVARQLLESGNAYYCYATSEELAAERDQAAKE